MEKDWNISGMGVIRAASWTILVVLVVVIMKTLAFLFIPFSFSLLLCYALGIPLDIMRRYRVPSSLRIVIVVFFIGGFLYLFGSMVNINIQEFQQQWPHFEKKFWEYAPYLLERIDMTPEQARETYDAFLQSSFRQFDLKPIGTLVQHLSGSFFSFLGNVFWVLIFMIFMLAERESFNHRLVYGLGKGRSGPVLEVLKRINRAVQNYLGLKTMISLVTGMLVAGALTLFQVPFALLWGVLAFLLNFIPNIGSLISVIPPVAITLFQFGSIPKALAVTVLLAAIQMTVGNVVEPKVMGKGLNLSPLVVLLSLVFWGWMWGIPGMFLSVPLTAAIKIAFEQVDSTRPVAVLMSGVK